MSDEITYSRRPLPRNPKSAWAAWETTVGYIHSRYSADATLRLNIYPLEHVIGWGASLTWGNDVEKVADRHAFSIALNDLWAVIEHNHNVLDRVVEVVRRPVDYEDDQILDEATYEVFSSLVNSTDTVFKGDWQIMIMYRPVETAAKRVQTRLTADSHQVNRAGNGATLRAACRKLLRNAAPVFHQYRSRPSD